MCVYVRLWFVGVDGYCYCCCCCFISFFQCCFHTHIFCCCCYSYTSLSHFIHHLLCVVMVHELCVHLFRDLVETYSVRWKSVICELPWWVFRRNLSFSSNWKAIFQHQLLLCAQAKSHARSSTTSSSNDSSSRNSIWFTIINSFLFDTIGIANVHIYLFIYENIYI